MKLFGFVRLLVGFTIALGAAANGQSTTWNGPGWYVTYSDISGEYDIYSGPYSDQSLCQSVATGLNVHVGSKYSGTDCEYLTKSLPVITDSELGGQNRPTANESSPDSAAAAAAGATDCTWTNHMCLDVASIKPGVSDPHSIGRFSMYDCATPSSGKCEREQFEVNCVTGIAYGLRSDGTAETVLTDWDPAKMPLMKELCPAYSPLAGAKERCLHGYTGLVPAALEPTMAACTALIDASPRSAESAAFYRERGYLLLEAKRYQDAISDLTQSIALGGDDTLAYSRRAEAYAGLGKYDLAVNDMTKAVNLVSTGPYGPESPANSNILADQLVERAEIYIRAKRYDEAVADAQRVITAPNVAADAYYLLSVAERALGRTPMADSDLARAKTLWSDVEDVYSKKLNP
jgi:hypothetical protein